MEEKEFNECRDKITAVSMNSNYIALGLSSGYKIYSLNPIKLIKYKDMGGGIGNIGLYSSDKIIWFVGGGEMPALPKNEFRLWDNQNDEQLLKIVMKSPIKQVCVKQETIWIALTDTVCIYTLPYSDRIIKYNTVENAYGVLTVAKDEETNIACFPGETQPGELVVYDYGQDKIKCKIPGDSKNEFFITCVALSNYGNILAATSSEGCTIHIYDASNGDKLKDFTRGSTPAEFNYLNFQLDDTRLIVGSDTGTIHVFIVDSDILKNSNVALPKNNVSSLSFLGGLIPYLSKIGSYCKFRIDEKGSISYLTNEGMIIALSYTGIVYFGQINIEEGGEATIESITNLANIELEEESKDLATQ